MSSTYIWPFAQGPNFAIPQVINYDLIIQEPYPGIEFVPTTPGGLYAEIRDVNNCLWFVQNAMWNPNTTQWEQDTPANPALPAYAIELCADGSFSYLIAPATEAIATPVAWTVVWTLDSMGNMTVEPLDVAEGDVAEQVNPTWTAGGASMVAREVNVTDSSSATNSYLDQLSVDGVVKWQVRKDGTLTVGIIPASSIPGVIDHIAGIAPIQVTTSGHIATISLTHGDYVDIPNVQTITGQKTVTATAGLLLGAATGAEGSVVGNATAQAMGYGAKFAAAPFVWQAEATQAVIVAISTSNTGENPDGLALYYDTGLTPGNTYNPTLVFGVNSTGHITNGTIPASVLATEFEGTFGITTSYDSGTNKVDVSGAGLLASIVSVDHSLLVTISGQVADITVQHVPGVAKILNTDGTLLSTAPIFVLGSCTYPSAGGNPAVTVTLSGDAVFTSNTSYKVIDANQIDGSIPSSAVSFFVNNVSGSEFTFSGGAVPGGVDVTINFVAIGF